MECIPLLSLMIQQWLVFDLCTQHTRSSFQIISVIGKSSTIYHQRLNRLLCITKNRVIRLTASNIKGGAKHSYASKYKFLANVHVHTGEHLHVYKGHFGTNNFVNNREVCSSWRLQIRKKNIEKLSFGARKT